MVCQKIRKVPYTLNIKLSVVFGTVKNNFKLNYFVNQVSLLRLYKLIVLSCLSDMADEKRRVYIHFEVKPGE